MEGIVVEEAVLILRLLEKLMLAIWNVVKELEWNWIFCDGIWGEFWLKRMGKEGIWSFRQRFYPICIDKVGVRQ